MNTREAVALLEAAVPPGAGTWADVGAGEGTFTRALARLLAPAGRIYAIDRDARVLATLGRWAAREGASVVTVEADFQRPLEVPGIGRGQLDGLVIANALHFARDAGQVLGWLAALVRPGGRVVIVEYDRRASSRWVPYPIPLDDLPELAAVAGLSAPAVTATRPSAYGGILYVAAADRIG